jgi:tyrosyl-tRNA synthetase
MGFLDELRWRGMLHQTTSEEALDEHLGEPPRAGYSGFDPTSDSLTIGNFLPIKLLMHWQRAGHRPIVIMGGATGMIGDPSGKDAERRLLTKEQVQANVASQRKIFERLLDCDPNSPTGAIILDNSEWLDGVGYIEMLRDVGKHLSVNAMIQKDSVKTRLENREQGISYTEFSYMLLQAYDFLHLFREHQCTTQIAGSDQYGNIVVGIDLIRRACAERGEEGADRAFGVTCPLLTGTDGKKIGKSETGALYLSRERTSPYAFYQYWLNVADADVGSFLKWFTFMTEAEVEALVTEHEAEPHLRKGQRALARAMTDLVHGEEDTRAVEAAAEALFGGDVASLGEAMMKDVFADAPSSEHAKSALAGEGMAAAALLAETPLAKSKGEATRLLKQGAVSLNGAKLTVDSVVTEAQLLHGTSMALRRGKKAWHITRWV